MQSVVCASTETIARDVNRTRNAKNVILRRDSDIVGVDAIARRLKSKPPRGSIETKRIESKRIDPFVLEPGDVGRNRASELRPFRLLFRHARRFKLFFFSRSRARV